MAYVELHQALFDHRKTIIAAELLNMQEVHLVGHLSALWCWCLDNCPDGILPDSHRVIARGARYTDTPSVLVDALIAAGFIEYTDTGLRVHDWENYGGKLIEKRRVNAEKQARYRQNRDTQPTPPDDVTVTSPSRNALEKSREEKRRVTTPKSPKGTYSPEFEEFWKSYPAGNGVKAKAYDQWRKVADERDDIMAGLSKWHQSDRWNNGYIKACELWLRDRMWENPPPRFIPADVPHNKGGIMRVVL